MGKKRSLLVIGVMLLLACAGVVYAHWTDSLKVSAHIATGQALLQTTAANTDDDGVGNGWELTPDNGGGTEYDAWGTSSSNDPSADRAATRYTKDVARCRVTSTTFPAAGATAVAEQVYPGYWCTIRSSFRNAGSVPMKNQAARLWVCESDCGAFPANYVAVPYTKASNSFWYDSADADSDYELQFQNAPGGVCGTQFDPGVNSTWRVNLHVLQDVPQNTQYWVVYELVQVNWNEYSLADCSGFSNQP